MDLLDDASRVVNSAIVLLKESGRVVVDRLAVMKTAYLIEREYFRSMKKRFTNLTYFNYTYGPYNELIVQALEKLASDRKIEKNDDYEYIVAFYNPDKNVPEEIGEKIVKILKKHKYSFNLVDYVHNLKEVRGTKFGEEIRFEKAA